MRRDRLRGHVAGLRRPGLQRVRVEPHRGPAELRLLLQPVPPRERRGHVQRGLLRDRVLRARRLRPPAEHRLRDPHRRQRRGGCFNACSVLGGDALRGHDLPDQRLPEGEGDCDRDFANGETDVTRIPRTAAAAGALDADNVAASSPTVTAWTRARAAGRTATASSSAATSRTPTATRRTTAAAHPVRALRGRGVCSSGACTWTDCPTATSTSTATPARL